VDRDTCRVFDFSREMVIEVIIDVEQERVVDDERGELWLGEKVGDGVGGGVIVSVRLKVTLRDLC